MSCRKPMAVRASRSAPADPKDPIRDWPDGYPAPTIGAWDDNFARAEKAGIAEHESMKISLPRFEILSALAVLLLFASACATPIGVNHVDPAAAYHSLTANAISAGRPSSFSSRELMNRNLYQLFDEDPERALAELHAGLLPEGDEDSIFALAELSFLHGQNSGKRAYYLATAVYAYSFILPGVR